MSDIPMFYVYPGLLHRMGRDNEVKAVLYSDHVAECDRRVAEAEQRGYERGLRDLGEQDYANGESHGLLDGYYNGYDEGQRDMLAKAIAAVEDCRVPWPTQIGDLVNEGIDDALAALRALLTEGSQ